tara:strand:- start:73668 stop:76736 length:3069 start_codon:yes stop_codon:yes gene_type:complete
MVELLITRKNKTIMYRKIVNMLMFYAAIGIFGSTSLLAQEQDKKISTSSVTGTVLNSEGEPISDIFVKSFKAKDKSITNENGKFTIKVSSDIDQIIIDEVGYILNVTEITESNIEESNDIILLDSGLMENGLVQLPYQTFSNNRSVSSTYTINAEELASYPSSSFLETLSGRIPGLVINTFNNNPTGDAIGATLRGEGASFYVDGIQRDPSDLTVYEIERVEVIKDMSGRAALGLSGNGPIIWITTKTGKKFKKDISITTESGFSSATSQPNYVNSYDYATLYNEALNNDGLSPLYSSTAINAYRNGSNPLYYPSIDYTKDYLKKSAMFQRTNLNFSGGDDKVNYFSLLDYVQTNGLEKVGKSATSNRFKLRGGVNIKLSDKIQFNVNLSGTYQDLSFLNEGGGANQFDLYNFIANNPSNAHAIDLDGNYIVSNDYPLNLENELLYGGYAEKVNLNSQNSATLLIDLNSVVKGLTFTGSAAFDIYSDVTSNKGGTAELFRLLPNRELVSIQEQVVEPNLVVGSDNFTRSTTALVHFNYDRVFGKHALTMNVASYSGLVESRGFANYQPVKKQDYSYRANYAYNDTYVIQLDLAYSGSMKMPEGDRYSLYPSIGAGWVASNESFLSSSNTIDYLKFYGSFGIMGNDNFRTGFSTSYNPYYLGTTLWQNVGGWQSGIEGNKGNVVNIYNIQQEGSTNYELPKRNYLNVGFQSELFSRALSVEANYFYQRDYNQISQRSSLTPSLFGTGGFLPLTNYGETTSWGLEGYMQYKNNIGDLEYSFGGNILYKRGKYVEVDEPIALEDYRKDAGKDYDMFRLYEAEGLYTSESEITSRGVDQSWGDVQPGDIRYKDFNNDGVVDQKDIHITGAHAPRMFYGVNLKLKYKSFGLYVVGQGQADGQMMLNGNYFQGNSPRANYSEVMLDRYPVTNNFPRLTTQSQNNFQGSTFWLESASYFSIKNVEFSYMMPKSLGSNLSLPNLKLFVRAKNVASFSKLSKYNLDPENATAGIFNYPIYKTFTLGVSCKF